ncbi:glycoside hydrolase family 71 protein [Corynespora cassiicola Philippines]|uniref:Glycoside hydrolase family 71 protein n=1 Tax=Corynespora cassiicola Philippines TaxID=1448308 RepID=A0A2T2NZI0_CORCC|nr:glycoside hydrolase family 71 protein [Corynespora cassiicola Philippines]
MRSFASLLAIGLLAALTDAAPYQSSTVKRQDGGRLVFAHFMMGIVPNRGSAADYDDDMKRAKAAGIDAFALNIGKDDYTRAQLEYAYESAAANDMKVFISFDFHYFAPATDAAAVGELIKAFGSKEGQLKVDDKVFVSSFVGDGLNVDQVRSASGMDLFVAPNFAPGLTADPSPLDGALNWQAWDSDGNNKAPKAGQNVTVADGDAGYVAWLNGKDYIAPVSPWFFTHYGPEVDYSKNWVFPGDLLWYNRWNEVLELGPRFLEILTWNDYGESHYIGPLASKHTDDGNSKWALNMPHNGWLDMAKPFIAAYKAGQKSPASFITEDQLVYWYRPTLKSLDCDATDTTMEDAPNPYGNYFKGRPDGSDTLEDAVFVVALLKEEGSVTVNSGSVAKTFTAPAGASAWKVEMGVGKQTFSLERGGQQVLSETSARDISDTCPCGIYNYNAYVGTVPAGAPDALDDEGKSNLNNGLKVQC